MYGFPMQDLLARGKADLDLEAETVLIDATPPWDFHAESPEEVEVYSHAVGAARPGTQPPGTTCVQQFTYILHGLSEPLSQLYSAFAVLGA